MIKQIIKVEPSDEELIANYKSLKAQGELITPLFQLGQRFKKKVLFGKAYKEEYRKKNREKINQYMREHYKNNKDYYHAYYLSRKLNKQEEIQNEGTSNKDTS